MIYSSCNKQPAIDNSQELQLIQTLVTKADSIIKQNKDIDKKVNKLDSGISNRQNNVQKIFITEKQKENEIINNPADTNGVLMYLDSIYNSAVNR